MTIREETEAREQAFLAGNATLAAQSRGREREIPPCQIRTCFQRDVDRIVHSKSFRRLKHKTQVFLQPEGDHYRTRMTHTLEVMRIARTIARALRLNEDLTEAMAFGHDLGHTPFGHAGERILNQLMPGGFQHNVQSLRVVERLENGGEGLNLTWEVRDGILCHTGAQTPATMEGQIIRLADQIAYINHDIDDAIRGGIIYQMDIPMALQQELGFSHGQRIDTLTNDVIAASRDGGAVCLSPARKQALADLRAFMFQAVYCNPVAKGEESKAQNMLELLFRHYIDHLDELPGDYYAIAQTEGVQRAVCDYLAGMTDSYAVERYGDVFIPKAWTVK